MSRTFSVNECALNEEIRHVARQFQDNNKMLLTIEPFTLTQAIVDILSLDSKSAIPGTEGELLLLDRLYCLMSMKNRKWLTESHVSLPYAQMISPDGPREAELKSRLYGIEERDEPTQPNGVPTGIELRNYFFQLLKKCLPEQDIATFPHLLTLFDNSFSNKEGRVPVLDLRAWSTLTLFQQLIFRAERQTRPLPPKGLTLEQAATPEYIEPIHAKIRDELPRLVAISAWRTVVDGESENTDSLFVRLGLNAAVNRFVLEQWAYNRRVQAAAQIQISLARELEKTAPKGFLQLLTDDLDNLDGLIDYPKLVQSLLGSALEERGVTITSNIYERIDAQVDQLIQSCVLDEFMGDEEINRALSSYPVLTKALGYLALAWSYACKGRFPEDDPGIHTVVTRLISSRSPLVTSGQHMVSLRRLISTLMNTQAFCFPSAYRIEKHIEHVIYVRRFLIDEMLRTFKTASLEQWDSVLRAGLSADELSEFMVGIQGCAQASP
ncbi:hypothetical protein [Pseudomonas sp. PGPR40]|uniref:hypothetical protein n=1 Tax=Pseudomonas sp. PGPR40 TaxID=2913476 RepID=UPI001EDC5CC5|nr:hypothetical protein [Pseudomonas sp. PGPR40]